MESCSEEEDVDVEECSEGGGASEAGPGSEAESEGPPSPAAPGVASKCNSAELLPAQCHLETKELWDKFHDLGTEMIITKTGR